MNVELSASAKLVFWVAVIFMGVPTVGLFPLYLWWVAHNQYPGSIDRGGIVTRNGKYHAFSTIRAVTPTPMKGGYWIDFHDKTRITLSPTTLENVAGIYAYLTQHSGHVITL